MSLDDRVNNLEQRADNADEERALLRQGILRLIDLVQEMRTEFKRDREESNQRFEILLQENRADRMEMRQSFAKMSEESNRKFAEMKEDSDRKFAEMKEDSDRKFAEMKEDSDRKFEETKRWHESLVIRLDK